MCIIYTLLYLYHIENQHKTRGMPCAASLFSWRRDWDFNRFICGYLLGFYVCACNLCITSVLYYRAFAGL
jgi:hypothetical protein